MTDQVTTISAICSAGEDHLQCEGCACPCHDLRFGVDGVDVKQGIRTIARAVSGNMAKRIANALNRYKTNSRGQ